jgi:hypothetical protein
MPTREPALPPLTHHQILARAAPFVRAGHAVDLPACDRVARRVVFRHRPCTDDGPGLVDDGLAFDDLGDDGIRLERRVTHAAAGAATLTASGPDTAALLAAVAALPATGFFLASGGVVAALDRRLDVPSAPKPSDPSRPGPMLREARARIGPLALTMTVSSVAGYPAELVLRRADPATGRDRLPDDLLAVLGRGYGLLVPVPGGWRSHVSLRGAGEQRSASARQALARAMDHLAETLAAAPSDFHPRHRRARFAVALRRATPLAVGLAVVGLGLLASRSGGPDGDTWLALLANAMPPLLLMALFLRREMLRLELPRWPRAVPADAWPTPAPRDPGA